MRFSDQSVSPPFAKDPGVCKYNDEYWLYYSLRPSSENGDWTVGIAKSNDLEQWEKRGEIEPEFDQPGICAPAVAVREGVVHLFYQTYGDWGQEAICHAVSTDGKTFLRNPHNPIFSPSGDWTNGRAIDAETVIIDNRCYLYYATRDPTGERQMLGLASAPIESTFASGDWVQHGNGPVLEPELDWETDCIEAPAVCERGGRYYLFYGGGYNSDPQQIGCAVSEDGISWTRVSDDPLLTVEPGAWNADSTGHPDIFTAPDGTTYLFYQGTADNGESYALSRKQIYWHEETPQIECA